MAPRQSRQLAGWTLQGSDVHDPASREPWTTPLRPSSRAVAWSVGATRSRQWASKESLPASGQGTGEEAVALLYSLLVPIHAQRPAPPVYGRALGRRHETETRFLRGARVPCSSCTTRPTARIPRLLTLSGGPVDPDDEPARGAAPPAIHRTWYPRDLLQNVGARSSIPDVTARRVFLPSRPAPCDRADGAMQTPPSRSHSGFACRIWLGSVPGMAASPSFRPLLAQAPCKTRIRDCHGSAPFTLGAAQQAQRQKPASRIRLREPADEVPVIAARPRSVR